MGCGSTTIKYLLFLFNLIFALGGLAILVIGAVIQWNIKNYGDMLDGQIAAPPILLIIVGILIFIVSFFGCCGAIHESPCMVSTYAVLVCVILIAQITGAVLILVYRDQFDEVIETQMRSLMKLYGQQGEEGNLATEVWDNMQQGLKCCGVDSAVDWVPILGVSAPKSCSCDSLYNEECIAGFYKQGCHGKLVELARGMATLLGAIALIVAFFELVSIVFACCLASSFRRKRTYNAM